MPSGSSDYEYVAPSVVHRNGPFNQQGVGEYGYGIGETIATTEYTYVEPPRPSVPLSPGAVTLGKLRLRQNEP